MIIAKFQADEEMNLHIPSCVAVVWVGAQKDVPTIMAFVSEPGETGGKNMSFYFKIPGDPVTLTEMHQFATAIVTSDIEYLMFGEKPSIIQQAGQGGPMPPGMAPPGAAHNFV